jgi:hypothetical protein
VTLLLVATVVALAAVIGVLADLTAQAGRLAVDNG